MCACSAQHGLGVVGGGPLALVAVVRNRGLRCTRHKMETHGNGAE